MFKKLHVLSVKSYLGPLALTFFIVLFLLIMQFLWKYIDDLVGKGLTFSTLSELLLYTSASLVPMALPLAILLAALMSFGNMGENLELLALKAAGISLYRIMIPLALLTLVISVLAFFFSNNVLPIANLKMKSLMRDIQQQKPELQIKEGIFYNGIQNYSIRIGKKDRKTGVLYDITVYDHTADKGNVMVTLADSGLMRITPDKKMLVVTMFNGFNYSEVQGEGRNKQKSNDAFRRDKFDKQLFYIELVGFGLVRSDENLFKNSHQMMNLSQLSFEGDSLINRIDSGTLFLYHNINSINNLGKKIVSNTQDSDSIVIAKPLLFDSLTNNLKFRQKATAITFAINNARSIKNYIDNEESTYTFTKRRINRLYIEWHRKFTLSVCCLLFFFIGAPLGAIIKKGGLGMPLVVSILFFVFYYVISITGEKIARDAESTTFFGMWISSFILLPIGVFLTYKATHDAAILNMDFYLNLVKKKFKKKK